MTTRVLPDDVAAQLRAIVGDAHVLTSPEDQAGYLREWRDRYVGKALAVVRPGSTDDVARILRFAAFIEHAIVHPAAFLWPPPPNFAASAVAS